MSVKKIAQTSARALKKSPGAKNQPGVACKTRTGKQYLILPGAKAGLHTLWESMGDGSWLEKAVSDSPAELSDLIDYNN